MDTSAGPTKRLFTFGQYSRFVRPNNYRIDATSSQSSVLVSAYKDTNSAGFAIVVVNTNPSTDVFQTFNLTNFTAAAVTPWITSASQSLAPLPSVTVTNGSFTYDVPAMSVVTFVGQGVVGQISTPPTLAPVADQTINVGQTLLVTNVATDAAVPPNTLTFNLLNNPAGATLTSLNPTNALFTWRAPVSQASTSNLVTVAVTDNVTSFERHQPLQRIRQRSDQSRDRFGQFLSGTSQPDRQWTAGTRLHLVDFDRPAELAVVIHYQFAAGSVHGNRHQLHGSAAIL